MDYPASIVPVNHVAPVPRRIRAYLGAEKVLRPRFVAVGLSFIVATRLW